MYNLSSIKIQPNLGNPICNISMAMSLMSTSRNKRPIEFESAVEISIECFAESPTELLAGVPI